VVEYRRHDRLDVCQCGLLVASSAMSSDLVNAGSVVTTARYTQHLLS
jgi:hypothetical protein